MISTHHDLEGICKSPHDFPASWALMLTMYLDESIEADNGYAVVAGFVGNDASWNECMKQWKIGLGAGQRQSLHMKSLRDIPSGKHNELLNRMGEIPEKCGLILVFASVRYADYIDLVDGTVMQALSPAYMMALMGTISSAMLRIISTERIEVICEEQIIYAALRASMFSVASKMPAWMTPDGLPRLSKISSIPKSMVLEPSDYASYALLQRLRDPSGLKAKFCSPILENSRRAGICMDRDQIRLGMKMLEAQIGPFMKHDDAQNKDLMKAFREVYGFQRRSERI